VSIAHRPASICHVDRIHVMRHVEIVPENPRGAGWLYSALFHIQAGGYLA
jgi:ABC-type multidrug transport system fused ATPase/permease subunit